MAGIGGKNTRPELTIRRALHSQGLRYRLHAKDLPGKPDIVFPRRRAVIFVHGCFWHGHECSLFRMPLTNRAFWSHKIGKNKVNDAKSISALLELGWRVLLIWECALKGSGKRDPVVIQDAVVNWIRAGSQSGEITGT